MSLGAIFALDAQDKLKVLIVDGDPQTSLVQSEDILHQPGAQSGRRCATHRLPPDSHPVRRSRRCGAGIPTKSSILCNVASSSGCVCRAKLQDFLRQGGGVLIFSAATSFRRTVTRKNSLAIPSRPNSAKIKIGPEANGEKIVQLRCQTSGPAVARAIRFSWNRSSPRAFGVTYAPRPSAARRPDRARQRLSFVTGTKNRRRANPIHDLDPPTGTGPICQ